MKKVYYAVYDKTAEMFGTPFLEVKDGTAVRAVQDIVINSSDHAFAKHPKDFSLHRLGEYDDVSGEISGSSPKKLIEIDQLGE